MARHRRAGRAATRLPALPEACRIPSRKQLSIPGLVQRTGALLRARRCRAADRRPGARPERREPDWTPLYRRLRRDFLLYGTLLQYGLAAGTYGERPDDGLVLTGCRITNAVRCVPPENKPLPGEAAACRGFLTATLREMHSLKAVLALGKIAFDATVKALGQKASQYRFAHGAAADIGEGRKLFGSYHCSRYNTNTGQLTPAMFHSVFEDVTAYLGRVA